LNLTLAALIVIFFALVIAWIRIAITAGSIKKQWWPLVIGVFVGWNSFVPLVIRSVTYHGKVIDEESGAPLAGAVVAVIWYDSPIFHMAKVKNFQTAHETITATDGSFSLWTWPGISFNPFSYLNTPPEVIIYKAGFTSLSLSSGYERGFATYDSLADALQKGGAIKLRKLRTREEALRFTSVIHPSVPNSSLLKLRSEIDVQIENMVRSERRCRGGYQKFCV
jgi:hypothetical protein